MSYAEDRITGKKYIKKSIISIDELIDLKKKKTGIRKVVYGISPKDYGRIYNYGGYMLEVSGTPEEIERRLKEARL